MHKQSQYDSQPNTWKFPYICLIKVYRVVYASWLTAPVDRYFLFLDAIASLGLGVSVMDDVKNLRDLRVLIALMVFIKSLHGLIGLHGLRYLHGLNGLMDLKSLPKLDSVESIKSIHRGPNVPNVFMLSNVVRDWRVCLNSLKTK